MIVSQEKQIGKSVTGEFEIGDPHRLRKFIRAIKKKTELIIFDIDSDEGVSLYFRSVNFKYIGKLKISKLNIFDIDSDESYLRPFCVYSSELKRVLERTKSGQFVKFSYDQVNALLLITATEGENTKRRQFTLKTEELETPFGIREEFNGLNRSKIINRVRFNKKELKGIVRDCFSSDEIHIQSEKNKFTITAKSPLVDYLTQYSRSEAEFFCHSASSEGDLRICRPIIQGFLIPLDAEEQFHLSLTQDSYLRIFFLIENIGEALFFFSPEKDDLKFEEEREPLTEENILKQFKDRNQKKKKKRRTSSRRRRKKDKKSGGKKLIAKPLFEKPLRHKYWVFHKIRMGSFPVKKAVWREVKPTERNPYKGWVSYDNQLDFFEIEKFNLRPKDENELVQYFLWLKADKDEEEAKRLRKRCLNEETDVLRKEDSELYECSAILKRSLNSFKDTREQNKGVQTNLDKTLNINSKLFKKFKTFDKKQKRL